MNRFWKKSFFGFLLVALLSASSFAESTELRKSFEIAVNPVQLFNGKLPLAFRFALAGKVALGLHFQGRFFSYDTSPVHGLGGGLGLKFYLNGEAIGDSWYLEPTVFGDYNKPGNVEGYWGITPTLIFGHTWVWTGGFVINLGLGAAYGHTFVPSNYWAGRTSYGVQGLMATGEFSLGWSW